ncbi:MAG: PAS domain S-box protein, partial [Candidatus Aminicenantes bacterium]|nr:PAS domain S-box protein [Candidatus Aminicenantes bacterium]
SISIQRDITESKQAEEALKESETRLRQLFESIPDAVMVLSSEGKFLDCNEVTLQLLGYSQKEFLHLRPADIVHPDFYKTMKENQRKIWAGKKTIVESAHLCKDGSVIPVEVNACKIEYKGEPNILAVVRDITERKKAEEALKESEEFNFALFEHNPIQTIAVDNLGKVTNYNMAKKTSGDRLPNIGDVMYKDYAGKHEINMHAELMKGIKSKKEKRFPEMKYRDKYLDITLASFPQGAIITTQDITERKQAKEALRSERDKLNSLIHGLARTGIGIDIVGIDYKILYQNQTLTKRYGNLTGKLCYEGYMRRKKPCTICPMKKAVKNRKFESTEITTPEGRIYELQSAPLPNPDGTVDKAIEVIHDITERKQAEEALRESEDKYRKLFELGSDALFLIEVETGRILDLNDTALKMYGYSREEALQKKNTDFSAEPAQTRQATVEHEQQIPVRYHKKKDGTIFPTDISVAYFAWYEKEVCIAAIRDITERERAEEALKESEEKYRTLTENVNVGIYRSAIKPDGKFIEANPAFVKILGYKNRDDMLATRILNIYQIPEDRKKFIEKLSRDGFVRNEDLKLKKKDGSPIICSVSAVTIKDKKGKAKYYDGIIENITERKLAEEAMRKCEMTYRALFESGNDPVILFSLNGTIVSANQKAAEILGYNVEELIGMSYKDIIASSEIKDADDKLKSLQEGKTFLPYERTVYKKNGTEFPSEVNLSLVQDENNKPVFLQSIFRDITERKRADEELLTSREQLRNLAAHLQAVREGERTSIAREIHDDLGQTMTALKMDLSLLGTKLPKDQKSLLKKTKSMSKLIDSTIQTVQRISAELRPGVLDDIGLTAALEWQGGEFQKRTGIKCELTVDPEDIFLDKDCSTAIFRIFQETLTNVARHSKAKWVKVNLKKKARRLELKIRDNGRGITEEQISNSKSFGLIGIRERVQFLGGEVEIRGIQNRGTTLKAWIPLPKDKK